MHRAIRSLAFALALLVLASSAVHARPLAARPSPTGVLDTLWRWAASHLPAWSKEGGMMDPDGNRHNLPTPFSTTDSGGAMDPDGNRHNLLPPHPTADAGGMMDPNG